MLAYYYYHFYHICLDIFKQNDLKLISQKQGGIMYTINNLRMATKTSLKTIFVAVALASFGNAHAEESQPSFSTESWYAIGGSGLFYPDADLDAKDDTPGVHFRLGREVTENIDLQVGLSYFRAEEDSPAFDGGHYKQLNFSVDALYLLNRSQFRPFVLAGIGASNNKINYTISPGFTPTGKVTGSNTSFSGNVGLGFQYLFNDNLGIQADIRRVFSDVEVKTNQLSSSEGSTGSNQVNLGLVYRFGGKPAPVLEEPAAVVPVEKEVVKYVPSPAPPPVTYEKKIFSGNALFDLNSATLTETGKNRLKADIADKLNEHPEVTKVTIEGHTDRLGNQALNERLSLARAKAVENYLIGLNIDANRLEAVGKSSSEPIVDCPGARSQRVIDCLQPNRRVEIVFETTRIVQ